MTAKMKEIFTDGNAKTHEISQSYYKEVPIKHIRDYYTRLIDNIS